MYGENQAAISIYSEGSTRAARTTSMEILKQKKDWIADALATAKERRRFFEQQPAHHLPERLELCAIGETWSIDYRVDEGKSGLWLRTSKGQLTITSAGLPRKVRSTLGRSN